MKTKKQKRLTVAQRKDLRNHGIDIVRDTDSGKIGLFVDCDTHKTNNDGFAPMDGGGALARTYRCERLKSVRWSTVEKLQPLIDMYWICDGEE